MYIYFLDIYTNIHNIYIYTHIIVVPQNGWFRRENPNKKHDDYFGYPYFRKPPYQQGNHDVATGTTLV